MIPKHVTHTLSGRGHAYLPGLFLTEDTGCSTLQLARTAFRSLNELFPLPGTHSLLCTKLTLTHLSVLSLDFLQEDGSGGPVPYQLGETRFLFSPGACAVPVIARIPASLSVCVPDPPAKLKLNGNTFHSVLVKVLQ